MMTYIDCGAGIAGDMLIGALVNLGLRPNELNRVLHKAIPAKGWKVVVKSTERQMWPAIAVTVEGDRRFGSAEKMQRTVARARLPTPVKKRAQMILQILRDAESHAHKTSHPAFEDRGLALLDTLVDVIGSAWGLWRIGINQVRASPLQTGRFSPAAAWIAQTRKIPVYSEPSRYEMATPTGVAILAVVAENFGWMDAMQLDRAGFGAGQKDIPGRPNVLAIYQGSPLSSETSPKTALGKDRVVLLETVIDDMDPRLYPHVMDLLFSAGALDVWWGAVAMKKGRPGIGLSALCPPAEEARLAEILFRETTTLGIRRQALERWVLPRRAGGLRKMAWLPNGRKKVQIEYEVAKRLARKNAIPLRKLLKYPS